jgi:hypothetical protein
MNLDGEPVKTYTLPGWLWEVYHIEDDGTYYGQVTSPLCPHGEYGTFTPDRLAEVGAQRID